MPVKLTQSFIWFRRFIFDVFLHHGISSQTLKDGPRFLHSVWTRSSSPTHLPFDLQVEITTACNLRCMMCKGAWPEQPGKHMHFEAFRSIVDQLPALYRIVSQGIGEPLLNPDLFHMIEHVALNRIAAEFTTNATLLDTSRASKLVAAGLYAVTISLDGASAETYDRIRLGASFAQVVENLRALQAIKRAQGARLPKVRFNVVVMKTNLDEIADILHLARALDVEMVILSPLQACTPTLAQFACEPHEWQSLDRHIVLARKLGIDLIVYQPPSNSNGQPSNSSGQPSQNYPVPRIQVTEERYLSDGGPNFAESVEMAPDTRVRNTQNRARSKPGLRARRKPPCNYPWTSLYVTVDGYVMPCCWAQDPGRHHLGNAFVENLASIWRGTRYQAFRRQLTDPSAPLPESCSSCPLADAARPNSA